MAETNVRSPLFDRLVDGDPFEAEARPLRTLDRAGLRQSVRRELELLFNTRSQLPAHRIPLQRSVIDYGIPDFGTFSPRNPDDRDLLADTLRRTASAYEPRLSEIRVHIDPIENDPLHLRATIEAMLVVEGVREPVSFEASMDLREGRVLVR
jgi:type VI secretion system protein ImpF